MKNNYSKQTMLNLKKISIFLLAFVSVLPFMVSAKEYELSNGVVFEGTPYEYNIAEKILEESKLPLHSIYTKAFEKINKNKKYKIFDIKDVVSSAQFFGDAGYDKKGKVFYLDSKNGKSEILLTINHPFISEINREKFIIDFSKEIKKNIKKELNRDPLNFKEIDIKEGTDLYDLANYYVIASLLSSFEDADMFKDMFLKDIRIDFGKVKNKCADVNRCSHFIVARTLKDSVKVNEDISTDWFVNQPIGYDYTFLEPQTNFKTKTIFFKNAEPVVDPVYVHIVTDQDYLSPSNDRIDIKIQDIRILSELKTGEAGL